jgi:hypothetical protein
MSMTQEEMVDEWLAPLVDCRAAAKRAKFRIEFMAMMLLAGRKDEAAEAYEEALRELVQIIGD